MRLAGKLGAIAFYKGTGFHCTLLFAPYRAESKLHLIDQLICTEDRAAQYPMLSVCTLSMSAGAAAMSQFLPGRSLSAVRQCVNVKLLQDMGLKLDRCVSNCTPWGCSATAAGAVVISCEHLNGSRLAQARYGFMQQHLDCVSVLYAGLLPVCQQDP